LSWQAIGDALLLGFAATVFGEIRAAELVLLVGSYVLLAVIINGYDVPPGLRAHRPNRSPC
jgi:hypothetical protein